MAGLSEELAGIALDGAGGSQLEVGGGKELEMLSDESFAREMEADAGLRALIPAVKFVSVRLGRATVVVLAAWLLMPPTVSIWFPAALAVLALTNLTNWLAFAGLAFLLVNATGILAFFR